MLTTMYSAHKGHRKSWKARSSTLVAIVDDYIARCREVRARELSFYGAQKTIADAVREAALSRTESGKRHSHQRRIPRRVLGEAERRLQASVEQLALSKSFSDLHRAVETRIRRIQGIGELVVYDIAHRIGAHLGLKPEHVYLHAGTRKGAQALGFSGDRITREEMPPAFHRLSPEEIEDCLCIYKSNLESGRLDVTSGDWCGPGKAPKLC